ncbi:anti-repressor SinI family protein [Sporosarcina sp. D27]|uniref:anti-repressor SinI family protein n=1 Tax=Sporosarcina sp. D27 TaxID=1382305 RepID=UPI0004B5922F|nr:anti-repressor SinI family protein [Sporosarcina sp. D27]
MKNDREMLDGEWVFLMKKAKNLGISTEEVREFLKNVKLKEADDGFPEGKAN